MLQLALGTTVLPTTGSSQAGWRVAAAALVGAATVAFALFAILRHRFGSSPSGVLARVLFPTREEAETHTRLAHGGHGRAVGSSDAGT